METALWILGAALFFVVLGKLLSVLHLEAYRWLARRQFLEERRRARRERWPEQYR